MKQNVPLVVASLLSILLTTLHLADDILFGMSPPGYSNVIALAIFAAWLYGAVVLAGRPGGYAITLLGGLFGLAVPIIHMQGAQGLMGGRIGQSDEAFFFVWTALALGATSAFAAILAAMGLWTRAWRQTAR